MDDYLVNKHEMKEEELDENEIIVTSHSVGNLHKEKLLDSSQEKRRKRDFKEGAKEL